MKNFMGVGKKIIVLTKFFELIVFANQNFEIEKKKIG